MSRIRFPSHAAAVVAALLLGAGAARADHRHFFVMPDIPMGQSTVGGELTFGSLEENALIGLEASLRWALGDSLSLNGILPVAHSRDDLGDGTSLGNVTLGATYLLTASSTGKSVRMAALDASLSLPTASDRGDAGDAALDYSLFYIPDLGLYNPGTTTLRVSGDYAVASGPALFQVELSLQQLLIDGDDDLTLVRLGLGGGYIVSPRVALFGELTTVSQILEEDARGSDDFLHTLDLGLRVLVGTSSNVGVRLYLPLDDSLRDQDIIGMMVSFRAAVR